MSLNRERLEARFREEYERLNEKQRRAVDTIDGPVMVIAGPGTGKTQILASRIGKILLDTDAYPENILCLTYTEAGVLAMRKRLLSFIGPAAYKVSIHTFHAFCNEVIQENLFLFEKISLDPISELEKISLLKRLIDELPKNHRLKRYRGDVYFEIHNLDSLFSNMKREGWTPEFINEKIDNYLLTLHTREEFIYKRKFNEFKPGDLKKDQVEEEKERMERLRAAVNEYQNYQRLMRKANRYDFDDMINWVIRAFENDKNLLARYQEKYMYILVDEFQDTSGTQNRIVELLINYWDKPNVFVVGDDDQSIFRFQGANVENMLQFADTYKNSLLTVVLTNNYRSTQPILDISKTLINSNEERLVKQLEGLSKELLSSKETLRHITHLPLIKEYESQRQEMIDITRQIQQLILQGVAPGEIAVIYRENKYGEELMGYFRQRNIPVFSKRNLDILQIPLAGKLILLLKYLAAEHDIPYGGDAMLFEILHFDWFGIPPIEIAKLTAEVADKKTGGEKTSIRQWLTELTTRPSKDLFTPTIQEGLKKASRVLEQLIADVPNLTLQTLVEKAVRETGMLSRIMQSADKHWELQVLTGVFDFIREETRRNPIMKLQQLVDIFNLMENENIILPLVRVSGNEKGVNLLTVHGSKGLEFEYVFFAGCNAGFWEKKRKPSSGYKLPDNLFASYSGIRHSDTEELRRLFYVALTRAEQHLILSYCTCNDDGKETEPSMFIAEILDKHTIDVEKVFVDKEVMDEFAHLRFAEEQLPEISKNEEEFIDRILDKFVMNVTALNNYLRCPLEFYFRNLVRIPSPKNEATEFGSAVHYALERLFRKMQDSGKEEFPGKEEFLADFNWYMNRHRENFTREQFDRRTEYGAEVLSNYYEKNISSFNKIVSVERNIRNVVVNNVPIKGKLDKLEFDGKLVNVVDYKTGDPDKAKAKTLGPSEKNPRGGEYWRQAVFYKLLLENYTQKDWKVISTEFDFIEPDKKKNYRKEKILIKPEDTSMLVDMITEVWDKIQQRDFYIGCGKEDCHWCSFVKTNELVVAVHEEEEPEG